MSLIGSLVIGLSVQTGPLAKGMKQASGLIGGFTSSLGGALGKVTAIGGALAGLAGVAGLAGIGLMLKNSFEGIDELGKSADKLGVTASALSALQFAATQSDVEIETLQAGLQKLNVRLGEAAGGSASAEAAFGAIGLSAQDLAGAGSTEALTMIADKIAGIQDPAQQAAAAVAIFGKQGVELLPLLKQGAAGIDALEAEAERLGLVMNDTDVAKVKEANDAIDKVKAALTGVFNTIAVQVAPIVTGLADKLLESGFFGENAASMITTALEWVVTGIAYAVDSVRYFQAAWYALKGIVGLVATGIIAIITGIVTITANTINGLFELVGMSRSQALDGAAEALQSFTAAMGQETSQAFQDFDSALSQPSMVDGVKQFFEDMQTGADDAANAIKDKTVPATEMLADSIVELGENIEKLSADWQQQAETFGMSSREAEIYKLAQQGATEEQLAQLRALDEQLTAQEKLQKIQEQGKQITAEVMTPLEKYEEKMRELDEALEAGAISEQTFGRAQAKALEELQGDGGKLDDAQLSGAASLGSIDAATTLTRAASMGRGGDPMQSLSRTADQQLAETKSQTALLRQLRNQAEEPTFSLN